MFDEVPFKFGRNVATSGIRTHDFMIQNLECFSLGHADASSTEETNTVFNELTSAGINVWKFELCARVFTPF